MAAVLNDAHDLNVAGLEQILIGKLIRSVYQPIVDLDTGATVAYEALARGPLGSPLEAPDLLFAAARRERRLTDLDRACRTAAIAGARAAGLVDPWTLFVNIEPEAAREAFTTTESNDDLRVVVELTERALTADPTQLLRVVERIRSRGWGIALDDVGADRASLALLPLLRPDVIKLDLRLVQQRATADIAEIVSAVNAEAERSGTVVLAEGI
jgi:EAL domain-containing protein (putative c-di-GMP-specific phosphodiesterase class I)